MDAADGLLPNKNQAISKGHVDFTVTIASQESSFTTYISPHYSITWYVPERLEGWQPIDFFASGRLIF